MAKHLVSLLSQQHAHAHYIIVEGVHNAVVRIDITCQIKRLLQHRGIVAEFCFEPTNVLF